MTTACAGMRFTTIDYPAWAMGCLVEVEPNVVLCTYTDDQREEPLLAKFIGFTEDRIEPVTAHE